LRPDFGRRAQLEFPREIHLTPEHHTPDLECADQVDSSTTIGAIRCGNNSQPQRKEQ
jgi:hypothetical protein